MTETLIIIPITTFLPWRPTVPQFTSTSNDFHLPLVTVQLMMDHCHHQLFLSTLHLNRSDLQDSTHLWGIPLTQPHHGFPLVNMTLIHHQFRLMVDSMWYTVITLVGIVVDMSQHVVTTCHLSPISGQHGWHANLVTEWVTGVTYHKLSCVVYNFTRWCSLSSVFVACCDTTKKDVDVMSHLSCRWHCCCPSCYGNRQQLLLRS